MEQEIIQEGMRRYLKILETGQETRRETVADRMFRYQQISGFLPVELTWVNGQKQYVFDISGKVSLEYFLPDSHVNAEEVRHMMGQILALQEELGQYLLDGNGVVIHSDALYVDPRTKDVYAIYNPESPHQGIPALARLLEDMLDKINWQDQELFHFIYGLHRLTKEKGTTREILKKYLEKRERGERIPVKGKMEKKQERHEKQRMGHRFPRTTGSREKGGRETDERLKKYGIPVLILLTGIVIPVVLWCLGWFSLPVSGGTDWTKAAGAFAFFLGVAGYGAWKMWPEKETQDVWLENACSRKICLISCQGSEEPLSIPYFPYVLGCEKERVDGMLRAGGVSPVHAQIMQEEDVFYVMDEESEGGTFHNDIRLVPWQKIRLQDGDFLRFGQGEYVVEIS